MPKVEIRTSSPRTGSHRHVAGEVVQVSEGAWTPPYFWTIVPVTGGWSLEPVTRYARGSAWVASSVVGPSPEEARAAAQVLASLLAGAPDHAAAREVLAEWKASTSVDLLFR